MNPIPLSWTIGGAALLLGALGVSSWLLYGAIEDTGRLSARLDAKQAEADRHIGTIRAQEKEAVEGRLIGKMGEELVAQTEGAQTIIRGKTQIIIREVFRANDCHDPVGPGLRSAFDRLRVLDRETRDRRGDPDRSAGATAAAAPGAAPPRGAVTNCEAGEYLVRLFEHAIGLERQIAGIGAWVGEARRLRGAP